MPCSRRKASSCPAQCHARSNGQVQKRRYLVRPRDRSQLCKAGVRTDTQGGACLQDRVVEAGSTRAGHHVYKGGVAQRARAAQAQQRAEQRGEHGARVRPRKAQPVGEDGARNAELDEEVGRLGQGCDGRGRGGAVQSNSLLRSVLRQVCKHLCTARKREAVQCRSLFLLLNPPWIVSYHICQPRGAQGGHSLAPMWSSSEDGFWM